jgi:two-component system NtrC family sensor kinase
VAGETILIVDDAQQNHHFLNDYVLVPQGYKPLSARDGVEGLQMAIRHTPDLILLDLNMPRMDGMEVLRQMNAQSIDIPVILMTFHGSEDLAVEVYRMGVKDYVIKPFYPDEMLRAIEKSLGESRLKREKDMLVDRMHQSNRELQSRVNELNVLYNMGKSVTSLLAMDQLLPKLADAAVQITGAEEAYLMVNEGDRLMLRAAKRHDAQRAGTANTAVNDQLAVATLKNGRPLMISDASKLKSLPGSPSSAAYVPIMVEERQIGVLGVRNVKPDAPAFTNHHAALLSSLSDWAAIALENARNADALKSR